METSAHVAGLERKRAEFLQEAAEAVRSGTAVGRAITADEDSRVLELTKNAHIIEEELLRLRRHHNEWKAGEFELSLDGLRPGCSYLKSDSPRGVCPKVERPKVSTQWRAPAISIAEGRRYATAQEDPVPRRFL